MRSSPSAWPAILGGGGADEAPAARRRPRCARSRWRRSSWSLAVRPGPDPRPPNAPMRSRASCAAPTARASPSPIRRPARRQEIRRQIDELVAGGASDAEVRDHFVARYGDWILLAPSSPLPWLVPLGVVRGWCCRPGCVWLAGAARPAATAPRTCTPERAAPPARGGGGARCLSRSSCWLACWSAPPSSLPPLLPRRLERRDGGRRARRCGRPPSRGLETLRDVEADRRAGSLDDAAYADQLARGRGARRRDPRRARAADGSARPATRPRASGDASAWSPRASSGRCSWPVRSSRPPGSPTASSSTRRLADAQAGRGGAAGSDRRAARGPRPGRPGRGHPLRPGRCVPGRLDRRRPRPGGRHAAAAHRTSSPTGPTRTSAS